MPSLLLLRGAMGAGKSSVALTLQTYIDKLIVIEIDAIKKEKYGTTEICNPKIDFEEAGIQAKKALKNGYHVIVVETLCEKQHVEYLLNGAGLLDGIYDTSLSFAWLGCSVKTALRRNKTRFYPQTVKHQHRRYTTCIRYENELVIRTDRLSITDVSHLVLKHFIKENDMQECISFRKKS